MRKTSLILLFFVLFNITVFKVYWIPSGSMEPALLEDDYVYVYQLPYLIGFGEPEYEELLVFAYPDDPNVFLIKRLIGKPGDRIALQDNHLLRNDHIADEYYLDEMMEFPDYKEIIVPDDSYFFLGDRRDQSIDSRNFGFVEKSLIRGKAIYIIWPLERAGEVQ